MNDKPEQPAPGWTLPQRRALIIFLVVFLSFLCWQAARNRLYVPDPQPRQGARSAELESRIDPNSADWQTLAAIPGLGEKRAKAIVAYRDSVHRPNPARAVFLHPADLLRIRGIGPATVDNLRPYLVFPPDH